MHAIISYAVALVEFAIVPYDVTDVTCQKCGQKKLVRLCGMELLIPRERAQRARLESHLALPSSIF